MNPSTATALAALARTPARAVMRPGLIECEPDEDIAAVARAMAERRVHCVVVAGIANRGPSGPHLCWGILSDLDLVRALRDGACDRPVGELAGSEVVVIDPDDSLEHAAQLMAEHETAHLIVAYDGSSRPLGMLSTLDVARAATA